MVTYSTCQQMQNPLKNCVNCNIEHLEFARELTTEQLGLIYWSEVTMLLCYRRTCHLRNYMYKRSQKGVYLVRPNVNTRIHQAPVFDIPKSDTKILDRSILLKGGSAWNSLTTQIRKTPTYDKFKSIQKTWLLSMTPD